MARPRGAGVSNTIKYLTQSLGKSNRIELQCVSGSLPKPFPHIFEQDDSGFQIGPRYDAPRPPSTLAFEEAVAGEGGAQGGSGLGRLSDGELEIDLTLSR